ncbi:hypothetical protein AKJ09_07355 [Labilithrix luteola]|uniref:Outer membrane lipoprotein BamD-like domain-containing protein n=1 Tax=Labilithrix luteola TaxID=1391654 RepID=A0A0K1Q4U2_9BACT|nr:hypothetical protein [Labilithrix luteola]AKV00692.1 hypothetical protein AKJ09_07355 [Labilithrix luteola]
MTFERFNPPRADEQGPDALRALVRERRRGPSPDAANEISARIAARVAEAASSTAARSSSALAYSKLGAIAVVVAGGFLLAPFVSRSVAHRPPVAPPPVTAPEPVPAAVVEERAETPPKVDPVGTISVDELPSAAPVAVASATGRARPTPSPEAPPSVSELEAARRAQATLASNPGRALVIADQLSRDFPNGEFVQEREAIAVEALARLGRKEDALQRARTLLRRFPRTPYVARLEMVIGQPISPMSASTPSPISGDRADSVAAPPR